MVLLIIYFVFWSQVVTNQFSRVAVSGRCSFFGNVRLGMDVSLDELRKLYHVVSVMGFGLHSCKSFKSDVPCNLGG